MAATERNRTAAIAKELAARKFVQEGKGDQIRLEVRPFSDAAEQFVEWARGEHHDRPGTWKRLRGSLTSLKDFFGLQPLHTINVGQVQDFMAWRRRMEVKEVTLRHDLHALSPLFKYGMAHNWCRENPVTAAILKAHGSKMPSDADAVRIHVLSKAEEKLYFETCLRPPETVQVKSKPHTQVRRGKKVSVSAYEYSKLTTREYRDLFDICRLMVLQGPRPAEVMQARAEHVDLERGTWQIPRSKSKAGERTLHLTAEARSILGRRVAAARQGGWLFEGRRPGTHLLDVENAHATVLEVAKLAFVIYDFRHTFATRFYEATRDVEALRKVLGHSNLRTIQKYVHIGQQHVDDAMKLFEASWGQFGANATPEDAKTEQTSTNEPPAASGTIH